MGMFDVKELAQYVKKEHTRIKGRAISPIKMQKSLYFLFAYWGGFVEKGLANQEFSEINVEGFDRYLFNARIEAWVYGAVIPEVYHESNIDKFENENLFENKEFVKEFIDGVLVDTFNTSDFKLVDCSHEDLSWKNNFNYSHDMHSEEMPKESIIEEYARK